MKTQFYEDLKKLEKFSAQADQDLNNATTEPQRQYALKMCNRADLALHMLRSGHGRDAAFHALRFGA